MQRDEKKNPNKTSIEKNYSKPDFLVQYKDRFFFLYVTMAVIDKKKNYIYIYEMGYSEP